MVPMLSFKRALHQRRIVVLGLPIAAVVFSLLLIYSASQLYLSDRLSSLPWPASHSKPPAENTLPELLPEYDIVEPQNQVCLDRFSPKYLEQLRDHAISYCSASSRSDLTCFHTHARSDGIDSFCMGRDVTFNKQKGKFELDCSLRELSAEERERGLIPLDEIRDYWYETGVPHVFNKSLEIHNAIQARAAGSPKQGAEDSSKHPAEDPPKSFLLLKREGEGNPWHSLMEVFSTWMSFDVLRLSRDPSHGNAPLFRVDEDALDTQVVILDDRPNGPYFDLWTLFAKRKPIRLKDLAQDKVPFGAIENANIIIPLTGSSNPLWQPEPEVQDCTSAPTVSVFSRRVLGFYEVPDPPVRKETDPIIVTFIDRKSRRLQNQSALFEELGKRNDRISVRLIDFAAIPFAEQLRITRETDILVGVHGAGLTHSLFMREDAGALVEIQPQELEHYGFRMVSSMKGLSYFRVHAEIVETKGKRNSEQSHVQEVERRDIERREGWHWSDVHLEPERFFDVMDVAIKSMYSKGRWNHDVN